MRERSFLTAWAYRFAAAMAALNLCHGVAYAEDVLVADQAAFRKAVAEARPGDSIVLADGEWHDFQAVLDATGTADAPITLRAETPGGVRITGLSSLSIGGDHLVVSGLTFKDGYSPGEAVIAFRLADGTPSENVRLTQTVIQGFSKPQRSEDDSWVVLYGRNNVVDRNAFLGKTNRGPTLIVRLDTNRATPNEHLITENYFGPRPPLGGNGGETLRIGVSQTSDVYSGTVVRGNLFERASGEVEIISIKAEGNIVTENTFYESAGSVVFRHGGFNEISRNVFLGNGKPDTGGIRVINDSQTVEDNYLEGLRGRKFLGALVIMNGVPNSPQNRYHQVTDAEITGNTFIDFAHMGFGVGTDSERSAVPVDSLVADNLIAPMADADLGLFDDVSGVDFDGNVTTDEAFVPIAAAASSLTLTRMRNGLVYPTDRNVGAPRDLSVVARDAVGPSYFEKPPLELPAGKTIFVAADADDLREAVRSAEAGDTISLAGGNVTLAEPISVHSSLTIAGAEDGSTTLIAGAGLFEMLSGADLTIKKVAIVQNSTTSPVFHARGRRYTGDYRIALRSVEVAAGRSAVAPLIAAETETFANRIEMARVEVRDWPGAVISLSGDGLEGYYLAEDISIASSVFENVGGPVVSYGREGRDESTFGPRFSMTGTTLSGAASDGSALVLNGVDQLALRANTFKDSGNVVVRRRVLGLPFDVGGNTVDGATTLDMRGVDDEPMDGTLTADADGVTSTSGPSLVLTTEGSKAIRAAVSLPPLLQAAFDEAEARVARSFNEGVIVPLPADPGGGYTHERHKENYKVIHDAGLLYALTGDKKYKDHAEALLLAYARMYPDLPLHPVKKEQTPGRLFWQSLNESVWLVYAIQGYDAIRTDLSPGVRRVIEESLFRPMADFLSTGQPQTFDKIHNHGTWAAAAVGMTGYALDDGGLVERALMGLDGRGNSGFLAQMDQLFSPDGYYTEGPYYQRYALMPFVLFGQAIDHNEPQRGIFERRDGILLKAITATIEQSYAGKFFAINDAIKEKGLDTPELVYGVAAAYGKTNDPGLISIAQRQGVTVLTGDGLAVAKASAAGEAEDFAFKSRVLRDGPDGDQGGLAILRMGDGEDAQTAVLKHTGQGMGHGHFDKLALTFYDRGREVVTDYGAARFLNVPSKEGGRYLPENQSFAKQTIAHNTVVVGGESHFGGNWKRGQESWPTVTVFEPGEDVQVVSATIDDAYNDAVLTRTTVQVARKGNAPILIDLFDVVADAATQLDLPLYFDGQFTGTDLDLSRSPNRLLPLGEKAGYQHLWLEAKESLTDRTGRFTWLSDDRFYTYHTATSDPAEAMIVRTGANDPNFNLRSEQGVIVRMSGVTDARFVSVIEPHGLYDPAQEVTLQSDSEIESIEHAEGRTGSVVRIAFDDGTAMAVGIAPNASQRRHRVRMSGRVYSWSGATEVFEE